MGQETNRSGEECVGSGRESIPWWAIAAVLFLIALVNALYCWGYTIDDPWITYRYADNLAAGKGLVFNPGERLESYSSLTHVIILAAVRRLGFDLDLPSRLFGLLTHLATVGLLLFAGWRAVPRRPILFRCLAPAALAFSFPAAAWAVGGLETGIVEFLMLVALLAYVREETSDTGFRWSAILLFLLATTRVEGALVFFCLVAHQAALRLFGGRKIGRRTVAWFAVFAVLYGAYTVWRWAYFGDLLPNTYYAKATGPLWQQWLAGARYCLRFTLYSGVLPLLFCFAPLFWAKARERALPWLFVVVGYTGFIFYCGGDWMPFYRFFVHVLPLIYWLFQEGAWAIHERAAASPDPERRAVAGLLIALAILGAVGGNLVFLQREMAPILGRVRRGTLIKQYFEVAEYLKETGDPDQLLAGSEAGVIPYVSGMRFLDIVGVLDRHVARRPGLLHWKSDPDYVLGRKPDWIVVHAFPQKQDGWWIGLTPAGQALLHHPEFRRRYTLVKRFVRGDSLSTIDFFLVFKRKPPASKVE